MQITEILREPDQSYPTRFSMSPTKEAAPELGHSLDVKEIIQHLLEKTVNFQMSTFTVEQALENNYWILILKNQSCLRDW